MNKIIRSIAIIVFAFLTLPLIMNHRPLIIITKGKVFFPFAYDYFEDDFGGEHHILVNYEDIKSPLVQNAYVVTAPYRFGLEPQLFTENNEHLLGKSALLQDLFAYTVYAIVISALSAVILTIVSLSVGSVLGCYFAIAGGRVDLIGQWLNEVCRSIPFVLLVVVSSQKPTIYFLSIFALTQWSKYGTIARTYTYKILACQYVEDAQQQNMPRLQIIKLHILPSIIPILISQAPHTFISYLTLQQSLAYFGLTLLPNYPSLGGLIQQAQQQNHILLLLLCSAGFISLGLIALAISNRSKIVLRKTDHA